MAPAEPAVGFVRPNLNRAVHIYLGRTMGEPFPFSGGMIPFPEGAVRNLIEGA